MDSKVSTGLWSNAMIGILYPYSERIGLNILPWASRFTFSNEPTGVISVMCVLKPT